MNDEERKEKLLTFLQRVPPLKLCKEVLAGKMTFYFIKHGIRLQLMHEKVQGRTVNAAEGGMLIGEGEYAATISYLPVEVDTHRVTLSAFDVQDCCVILASYAETGSDAPSERWVDATGKLKPLSPLFETYRTLQEKYKAYEQLVQGHKEEQRRSIGLACLDGMIS